MARFLKMIGWLALVALGDHVVRQVYFRGRPPAIVVALEEGGIVIDSYSPVRWDRWGLSSRRFSILAFQLVSEVGTDELGRDGLF